MAQKDAIFRANARQATTTRPIQGSTWPDWASNPDRSVLSSRRLEPEPLRSARLQATLRPPAFCGDADDDVSAW
jgi:hypothetical protein